MINPEYEILLVEDDFDPVNGSRHPFLILQVTLNELDAVAQMNQIVERPRAEVIEHAYGLTVRNQSFSNVRPDESRSTGDQIFCHF